MIVSRKEKETNQQVLRRFNRLLQQQGSKLQEVREKKEFAKKPNRAARLRSAIRRKKLLETKQWY